MKNKTCILLLFFVSVVSNYSFAEQTTIREANNGSDSEATYTKSTRDTIAFGDSIVIIHTVCAPICSSHVRVYNKEGELHAILKPPFKSAFPEAYLENGKVLWRDNDNYDYTPVP